MATYREHPSRVARWQDGAYVVHPDALAEDCTVWFPLVERDDDWEALLARRTGPDRARICAIPIFVYGLNLGDEVEVVDAAASTVGVRVLEDGGNWTYRVLLDPLAPGTPDERWRQLLHELEPLGCWFDVYSPTLLAISCPAERKQAVADDLWAREQAGELQYETGSISG